MKALARDATRRLRFVVHAAGWLHSMVLHGHGVVVIAACLLAVLMVVQFKECIDIFCGSRSAFNLFVANDMKY